MQVYCILLHRDSLLFIVNACTVQDKWLLVPWYVSQEAASADLAKR